MVRALFGDYPTDSFLRGCAPLAEGPQWPARVDRAWVQEVELWREDFGSSLFVLPGVLSPDVSARVFSFLPAVTRQAPEGTRQGLSALTW